LTYRFGLSRRTFAILFVALTISVLVGQYFLYKFNLLRDRSSLLQQEVARAEVEARMAKEQEQEAERAMRVAQEQLQLLRKAGHPVLPLIEYCATDPDGKNVESAMAELGFELKKSPPLVEGVPLNVITFGSQVNPEDVKQVALALIRNRVEIKGIYRFKNNSPKRDGTPRKTLIEIGADKNLVNKSPLTQDDVQKMTQFKTSSAN